MSKRYFIIPALTAALVIGVASCNHSDEDSASGEAVEAMEGTAASENFTVSLDDAGQGVPAAPDPTAKESFFAKAAGKVKGVTSAEDLTIQEEEQPAEKQKAGKERKVRQKRAKTVKEGPQPEDEAREVKPVEVRLDTLESGSVWTSISPMDLTMNPVKNFAQDWMALVVGRSDQGHNAMTIAWGTIGQLWNKPVVIVFVSEDRYTKHLLDACHMFSVVGFPDKKKYKDALLYIGSHSQKDELDKTENAGLTVERTKNGTPIIAEGNLAIECRKLYEDAFELEKIPSEIRNGMYQETGIHHMYIGEIVSVLQKN